MSNPQTLASEAAIKNYFVQANPASVSWNWNLLFQFLEEELPILQKYLGGIPTTTANVSHPLVPHFRARYTAHTINWGALLGIILQLIPVIASQLPIIFGAPTVPTPPPLPSN